MTPTTEAATLDGRPALVTTWRHPSGAHVVEATWLDTGETERIFPCGAVEPKPNPLGVAITLATSVLGMALGLVISAMGPPLSGATLAGAIVAGLGGALGIRVLWVWRGVR